MVAHFQCDSITPSRLIHSIERRKILRTRAWSGSVPCLRLRPQWLVFGELNHFDRKMSKEEKKNPLLSSIRPSKPRPKTEERRRVGAVSSNAIHPNDTFYCSLTAPALSGIIS